jgi:hypothetical protein
MWKKIRKAIKNPVLILIHIMDFKIFRLMPDSKYLRIKYRLRMGKTLDLDNPKSFNEKLQWLKLYDRKPKYTQMVDKYNVRKYVKDVIGEKYLIPLIGVYDSLDQIDFDKLPNRFVLKCTHDSGGLIVCKDKSQINIKAVKKKINKCLKRNFYYVGREWPYKDVKPRIICEEFIKTKDGGWPYDYKFHCFNGEPDNVMVCTERESGEPKYYFFDRNWNYLKYDIASTKAFGSVTFPKPKKLQEMFELAQRLSEGFPFLRVDLFCENDQIYFGELTFFPDSGFDATLLRETDVLLGNKLKLEGISKDIGL